MALKLSRAKTFKASKILGQKPYQPQAMCVLQKSTLSFDYLENSIYKRAKEKSVDKIMLTKHLKYFFQVSFILGFYLLYLCKLRGFDLVEHITQLLVSLTLIYVILSGKVVIFLKIILYCLNPHKNILFSM